MLVKNKKFGLLIIILSLVMLFSSSNTIFAFAKEEKVYLGGFPLGFDISSDGVLVVGLSEVICENGITLPAKDAGIKCGDYILSLNGIKIKSAQDIDEVLKNSGYNKIDAYGQSKIDKVLLNPFFSPIIFVLVMAIVFYIR